MTLNSPIPMKRLIFSALFLLSCAALVLGDTITLKDGTELEGTILSETADSYRMSVQVTAGIKDERTIPKSDVDKVRRSGPDDLAFQNLENLVPAPDRLTADQYRERIGRGQAFLNVYPDSSHAEKVKEMMATLEEERKLAAQGALKVDGEWISARDRRANAYEIDAEIEISEMEEDLEAGRYQAALRHFEKIERDFKASASFPKARELAIEALNKYKPIVARDYSQVDSRLQRRQVQMQTLPPQDRKAEQSAIEAREQRYEQLVEREKKAGTKWLTLSQFHKQPLRQVLGAIDTTLRRLQQPLPEDAKLAGPIYQDAWSVALAGNASETKKLISDLKSLQVPERYLEPLEVQLAVAEEIEKEKPAPTVVEEEPEEEVVEEEPEEETESKGTKPRDDAERTVSPVRDTEQEEKGFPVQIVLVIVLVLVVVGALVAAFGGRKNK